MKNNLARPMTDDKETTSEDNPKNKIMKVEGYLMIAMVGIIGWFANNTLSHIEDSIKEIRGQTQTISENVGLINTKVAVIAEDTANLSSRLSNDEQYGARFMPSIRSR